MWREGDGWRGGRARSPFCNMCGSIGAPHQYPSTTCLNLIRRLVLPLPHLARYASESVGDRECDGDDARDERGNNSIGPRVSSGATVNLEWDSDMPFSPMQGLSQSRLLVLAAVGAAPSVSLEADAVLDDGRTATSRPVGFETAAGTIVPKPDSLCEHAARATRNAVASEKPVAKKSRSKDVASVESRQLAQDGPSTPRQEMLSLASVDR